MEKEMAHSHIPIKNKPYQRILNVVQVNLITYIQWGTNQGENENIAILVAVAQVFWAMKRERLIFKLAINMTQNQLQFYMEKTRRSFPILSSSIIFNLYFAVPCFFFLFGAKWNFQIEWFSFFYHFNPVIFHRCLS